MEYAQFCYECQKKQLSQKGGDEFEVACKGIPKKLLEEKYYPLEEIYTEEEYSMLSEEEKIELQYKNNKILWAKEKLNWSPLNTKRNNLWQWYQEEMLCCTALKKVGRLARRMGKTEILVVDALHYSDTTFIKNPQTIIVTPTLNLCEEIYERILSLLGNSVFKEKFSSVKKPTYTIYIDRTDTGDTATIKLFTTGSNDAESIRGNRADKLIIDEGGSISQEAFQVIMPLVMEHDEVEVTVTSTPSELPNNFKEWCLKNRNWKEFHYKYSMLPEFKLKEKELRSGYTKKGWMQEIEAEFYETSKKVFKEDYIKNSLVDFNYPNKLMDITNYDEWIFMIGVDWNAAKTGVLISLLGFNTTTRKFKKKKKICIDENTRQLQTKALQEIIKLDEEFGAIKIVVDAGYGALQSEMLIKYYTEKYGDGEKIVVVDFGSNITEIHPLTKEKVSRRIKGVMVSLLQQRFEYGTIEISQEEEGDLTTEDPRSMVYQLQYYSIDKFDDKGNPVFKSEGPKGSADHALDSLMLASYGFSKFVEGVTNFNTGKRAISSNNKDDIENPYPDINERKKKLFSNNELRRNFMNIYDEKAYEETQKDYNNTDYFGRKKLVKIFGTTRKRLKRSSFR